MTRTTQILLVAGGLAAAAVMAYRLIPELRQLAANLRQLQLIMDDVDDAEDEPEEMYQVGSIDIKDPEVLRRINEALKDHPEGWVTRERPVRKPEPQNEPVSE